MTATRKTQAANGKRHATQQSVNSAVKAICDTRQQIEAKNYDLKANRRDPD